MIHFWAGTLLPVSVGWPCFTLLGFTGAYGTPGMAANLNYSPTMDHKIR